MQRDWQRINSRAFSAKGEVAGCCVEGLPLQLQCNILNIFRYFATLFSEVHFPLCTVWKYKLFWLHSHLYNYLNASEGSCVVFSYCFCNIPTFYLKIAFHIFLGWHKRFFRSLLSNMQYLPDFISCKHDNNRFLEHTENKKLPASAKVRQELVLPLCLVDFRRRNGPQTWNS